MKVYLCEIKKEGKKSINRYLTEEQIKTTTKRTNAIIKKVKEIKA